jgi:nucleoside-diphosphate-sugar epimerase
MDLDEASLQGMPGNVKKYQAAKILTRKETQAWIQQHQPSFAVYTFFPTLTVGPSLIQTSASDADAQNAVLLNVVSTGALRVAAFYVDVRNVAQAFVAALEADAPSGLEVILRGRKTTWREIAAIVKEAYPDEGFRIEAPEKEPDLWEVETKAAEDVLGVKWTPTAQLVRDVVDQQLSFRKGV